MFSQQNNRVSKRSKTKLRRTLKRLDRKLPNVFEQLEDRQLLTAVSIPWVANTTFNQFDPNPKALTSFGFGVDDGTGAASVQVEPEFIGFEFDEDISIGGKTKGAFGEDYGLIGELDAEGRFGIEYGFYINAGTGTLLHDGDFQYDIIPQGDGSWDITTAVNVDGGSLRTISPTISAYADLVLEMDGSIGGEACFVDCTKGSTPLNVDLAIPLVSVNRQLKDDDGNLVSNNGAPVFDGGFKLFGGGLAQTIAGEAVDLVTGDDDEEMNAIQKEGQKQAESEEAGLREKQAEKLGDVAGIGAARDARETADAAASKASKDKDDFQGQVRFNGENFDVSIGADISIEPAEEQIGVRGSLGIAAEIGPFGASQELGSVSVTLPEVNLVDPYSSNGNQLRASTEDKSFVGKPTIAELNLKVADIVGQIYKLGTTEISVGPFSAALTTLGYDVSTALNVTQTVEAELAREVITATFSSPVDAEVNGQLRPGILSTTFSSGDAFNFDPRGDIDQVDVEFKLDRVYSFTNDIGLDVDVEGTITILKAVLGVLGEELEIGPLFENRHSLFEVDLGSIFKKTFEVQYSDPDSSETGLTFDPVAIDVRPQADLAVAVTSAPAYVQSGDTFQVQLEVTNQNTSWASPTICLVNPASISGLTMTGPSGAACTTSGGSAGTAISTLSPGGTQTLTYQFDAGAGFSLDSAELDFGVGVARPSGSVDPNIGNNTVRLSIPRVVGQTFYVGRSEDIATGGTCEQPGQGCSLRDAVAAANNRTSRDIIQIAPGVSPVVTGTMIEVTDDVSIVGNGRDTIIDADSSALFHLQAQTGRDSIFRFQDLTLTGAANITRDGDVQRFLAVQLDADDAADKIVLENVRVSNNRSLRRPVPEAAIMSEFGSIEANRSDFRLNDGGAIRTGPRTLISPNPVGKITINDSQFFGNAVGAIHAGGDVEVIGSEFISNQSGEKVTGGFRDVGSGAAINTTGQNTVIKTSTFSANFALGSGGAIYAAPSSGGSLTIEDSKFDYNSLSEGEGAAVYSTNDSNSVESSVFLGIKKSSDGNFFFEDGTEFASNGNNLSNDYSAPLDQSTDTQGKRLFDITSRKDKFNATSQDGNIETEVFGAIVGNLSWNVPGTSLRELDAALNDDRFEIVGTVLKLKNDVALSSNTPSFELNFTFIDDQGESWNDSLKIEPGSRPAALSNLRVNTLQKRIVTTQGRFNGGDYKVSAELVEVVEATPGTEIQLLNGLGKIVETGIIDEATGNYRFKNVAGVGYTLRTSDLSETVGPFVVPQYLQPNASFDWDSPREELPLTYELVVKNSDGEVVLSVDDFCDPCEEIVLPFTDTTLDEPNFTFELTPSNLFGKGETLSTTLFTPFAPPTVPQDVKVTQSSTTEVTLSWKNAERVQDYYVTLFDEQGNKVTLLDEQGQEVTLFDEQENKTHYRDNCECEWENHDFGSFEGGVYEMASPIENLKPDTTYSFEIRAENRYGVARTTIDFRTAKFPVTQISGLQVQSQSPSSAQLTWNDVNNESAYQVHYGLPGETPQVRFFAPNSTSGTVHNLQPNSEYEFYVTASNSSGGTQTETITATTPNGPAVTILEDVTSPVDSIIRVDGANDGDNFAGAPPTNEDIENAFDNTTQKYLNFLDENSGVVVSPISGTSIVTGVRVYSANDANERDPASYKLEGLRDNGEYETISEGPLNLPAARNPSGQQITSSLNQATVEFDNSVPYETYRVTFPTLKDAGEANSMQVAEIELLGTLVSEPVEQQGRIVAINTGGDAISGSLVWAADTAQSPSQFHNQVTTTAAITDAIDLSHPSIPDGTPMGMFQSERWDPSTGAEMEWDIPVVPGEYEVSLYFAELFYQNEGDRIFDVSIEGELVLDDYDVVADVGARAGVVKTFKVDTDGNLDIDFGHVVENPKIAGITFQRLNSADVRGYLDYDNFIVLEGSGQELLGIDVKSPGGNLIPAPETNGFADASPFAFALANESTQVSFGVLGNPIILDGTLRTKIGVSGNPANVNAFWGDAQGPTPFAIEPASCDNRAHSIRKVNACAENTTERDEILAELDSLAGDLNGNGTVDFADFLMLSANFGSSGDYTDGDIDLDGTVSFADFLLMSANFGRSA